MILSRFLRIAILPLLFFLQGCYARPGENDLQRVRQQFLVNRFQAPFFRETKGLSDLEIFKMTCDNNRVRSELILEMLKEKDPQFYEKLTRSGQ